MHDRRGEGTSAGRWRAQSSSPGHPGRLDAPVVPCGGLGVPRPRRPPGVPDRDESQEVKAFGPLEPRPTLARLLHRSVAEERRNDEQ